MKKHYYWTLERVWNGILYSASDSSSYCTLCNCVKCAFSIQLGKDHIDIWTLL